jgi:GAF domain-containing protein
MENEILIYEGTKAEQYELLIPQIRALIYDEPDVIANLANIAAALKTQFKWLWVGFYLVKEDELVLGPFQGPVACTRIKKGRGVCGACWERESSIIVEDVNQFPGHIACSSLSKSELVIPIIRFGEVMGVLDIDSEHLSYFDETDKKYLELIVSEICI